MAKPFEQLFHTLIGSAFELQGSIWERARLWRRLIEALAGRDDNVQARFHVDLGEESEAFSCDFGVGQNIFDGGEFGFRQKLGSGKPVQQGLVNGILCSNARAENPDRFFDLVRESGDEKRLRRLNDV